MAFSLPPPHPGRASSSSGRAMHSTTIGASRERSLTCSIRSRNVGSAQWRSSNTTTSGRRPGQRRGSFRVAQEIFSLVTPFEPPSPSASETPATIRSPSRLTFELDGDHRYGRFRRAIKLAMSVTTSASGQYVMPSP